MSQPFPVQCAWSAIAPLRVMPRENDLTMIDTTTKSFLSLFRDGGVARNPCEELVIHDLQKQLGVELPAGYKTFVLLAGRGCEPLEGSKYAVKDDPAELQHAGRRIAADEKANLPAGAFVFLVHQGYACQFFVLRDMDDPAVFQCVEGLGPPRPVSMRFSDWLLERVARSQAAREPRCPGDITWSLHWTPRSRSVCISDLTGAAPVSSCVRCPDLPVRLFITTIVLLIPVLLPSCGHPSNEN